jgi:hypothetical protein
LLVSEETTRYTDNYIYTETDTGIPAITPASRENDDDRAQPLLESTREDEAVTGIKKKRKPPTKRQAAWSKSSWAGSSGGRTLFNILAIDWTGGNTGCVDQTTGNLNNN